MALLAVGAEGRVVDDRGERAIRISIDQRSQPNRRIFRKCFAAETRLHGLVFEFGAINRSAKTYRGAVEDLVDRKMCPCRDSRGLPPAERCCRKQPLRLPDLLPGGRNNGSVRQKRIAVGQDRGCWRGRWRLDRSLKAGCPRLVGVVAINVKIRSRIASYFCVNPARPLSALIVLSVGKTCRSKLP